MQVMYGVKVLNKLIAAWEAEVANRGYLRDNTVRAPYDTILILDGVPYLRRLSPEVPRLQQNDLLLLQNPLLLPLWLVLSLQLRVSDK